MVAVCPSVCLPGPEAADHSVHRAFKYRRGKQAWPWKANLRQKRMAVSDTPSPLPVQKDEWPLRCVRTINAYCVMFVEGVGDRGEGGGNLVTMLRGRRGWRQGGGRKRTRDEMKGKKGRQ